MPLKEKLMADMKEAMKSKNKVNKDVITMVRAAIKQREVDDRKELNDADVIDIIAKQIKQKKDSIPDFEKGNRQDLIDLTNQEIKILLEYLPPQLSDEELDSIVRDAIEQTGAQTKKDLGKLMALIMPKVKGKADGKHVNDIVAKYIK
ncbi:GatB/YqeY domain-containing protein [Sedimentibacter hydroxybenzoicus DSM 7310]|uniref:GatB/YqeY domain-containing protein n=1 Tax=Sedimentibacter hydroxybenzoicus DSM 7310 TaxID=1123245 RepID=A0A974BLN3_SEDHY|nr:GatB/YqeY domain-containing protein [Sedimentibacter hydroxybenzoicus]NYB75529.1 GatB/YqeY domain-containing protein [Sedimentibacter hydroxybenzoicus DSM 7310]